MAATESIIPPDDADAVATEDMVEPGTRTKTSLPQIFVALLVLGISAFLVWMSWPRLQASFLYLPVDTAIKRYYDQGSIDVEQLSGLQQRTREAIEVHPHYRYWDGLSVLHFLQAIDTERRLNDRRLSFEAVIETAERSLELAPGQPRTWLHVAQARAWLRYPPERVIGALKMAVFTGRVEPSMFITRLGLGLAYLPRMDGEGQSMMRDQVLLAWELQPNQLSNALQTREVRLSSMETLLAAGYPELLQKIRDSVDGAVR